MPITRGTWEQNGTCQIEWWIEPASASRSGICIHDTTAPAEFLTWAEFHDRVIASKNTLAILLADEIQPLLSSPAFCGRISVRSLNDLNEGMPIERFLHFLRTFLVGTLRHYHN